MNTSLTYFKLQFELNKIEIALKALEVKKKLITLNKASVASKRKMIEDVVTLN